ASSRLAFSPSASPPPHSSPAGPPTRPPAASLLLATPLTRSRWAVAGRIGVYLAIALITLVLDLGVGIGARLADIDAFRPTVATSVVACFAAPLPDAVQAPLGTADAGLPHPGAQLPVPVVAPTE